LDEIIEARSGCSVRAIFAELGEAFFRRLETEAISACADLSKTVIALGGGAFVAEQNQVLLRDLGTTVWINCPLDVCLARVGGDPERPMLGRADEMIELFEDRKPAYSSADFTVYGADATPTQVASTICKLFDYPSN
jgi:shikimate kinase